MFLGQILFSSLYPLPIYQPTNSPVGVVNESKNQEVNPKILVEIFLAAQHKEDLPEIKKKFGAVSISINRVRAQFFKLGNPPQNIAIGRNVPASTARLAIQIAIQYNQGIKYLLAEERLATDYIAIGTSMFDELLQIPIAPEDLERLSDPSLSTPQFHTLYRHLTGEDKRSQPQ